ncbi:UPF0754 membrane protein YheB [Paenibacillus lautus]|uniref:DUF445 domain-containing protein n=1 Tax=Paenibacillus lautus TaxID=1401 RepID=UPI001B2A1F35|nr:DUF445 family protein [Paenibacillus lautus]GIO95535.1 UPF0754 membrane protein YheB [Paenibacillus lautus]
MQNWLFILVNVCVAAFVGGITNHFAIKMLFHPREEKIILGRRIPFTPGLIPKRKDEIAESLGRVVSDYLVTSEGLQELIRKPVFRGKIEDSLYRKLEEWSQSELSFRDLALKVWSSEQWEQLKVRAEQSARQLTARGAAAVWHGYGLEAKPLKELVPGWSEETIQGWSGAAADIVLKELKNTLLSAKGQLMLSDVASSLIDKAGGFLGTMASIFVDEDKLVQKLTPMLIQQLEGEKVRKTITDIISGKLSYYGDMPLGNLIEHVANEPGLAWITRTLDDKLPWSNWIERIELLRVSEVIGPRMPAIGAALPGLLDKGLGFLERSIPAAMKAVNLPQLVQEQVEKFPIERLEEIILSVSGREFRAITWLGVLLGGVIGLFQSMLTMLWR